MADDQYLRPPHRRGAALTSIAQSTNGVAPASDFDGDVDAIAAYIRSLITGLPKRALDSLEGWRTLPSGRAVRLSAWFDQAQGPVILAIVKDGSPIPCLDELKSKFRLTRRECEVAHLMAAGLTDKQIGALRFRARRVVATAAMLGLTFGCASDEISEPGLDVMFMYDCSVGAPGCEVRHPSGVENANLAAMVERWADNGCEDLATEINFVSVFMWDQETVGPQGGTLLGDFHPDTRSVHIWAGQSHHQQGITLGHELLHSRYPQADHGWFDGYVEFCSAEMT
jgi:hypothetical protein